MPMLSKGASINILILLKNARGHARLTRARSAISTASTMFMGARLCPTRKIRPMTPG